MCTMGFQSLEGGYWRGSEFMYARVYNVFPILGGRLLKRGFNVKLRSWIDVSNPWREAIEGKMPLNFICVLRSFQSLEGGYWRVCNRGVAISNTQVSNPWREAIEVDSIFWIVVFFNSFQSLEGGYWRTEDTLGLYMVLVSNPWREAIEEPRSKPRSKPRSVSNPWREAIEAFLFRSSL